MKLQMPTCLAQISQREEHWVFADRIGKGARIRTVPIPGPLSDAVHEWLTNPWSLKGPYSVPSTKPGGLRQQASALRSSGAWSSRHAANADWQVSHRTICVEHARDFAI